MRFRLSPWLKVTLLLGLPLALILAWGSGSLYRRIGPGSASTVEIGAPVRVRVAAIGLGDGEGAFALPGTVVAEAHAVVASKLMAIIETINVQEGDTVTAGQVLATLNARDLDARSEAARAGTLQATAGIATATQGLAVARSGEERARAHRDAIASTLGRVRELSTQGATTAQALSDAEAEAKMAKASHEQARRQVEAARAQLGQATAGVRQAQAAIRLADADRSYARLVAPFAGIVVRRWLDPGAMAAPGQAILELERGAFRLDVAVEGRLATAIVPGQAVPVTLDAPHVTVTGHVKRVVPAVDAGSRTVLVKVALPTVAGLRAGGFGRAAFRVKGAQHVSLPAAALVRWYNLTSVYTIDDAGRAELRLVRLGERSGDHFEVLDGLATGDRVILAPPEPLRDGMRVEVTP